MRFREQSINAAKGSIPKKGWKILVCTVLFCQR